MPRKREYENNAARQSAYRERVERDDYLQRWSNVEGLWHAVNMAADDGFDVAIQCRRETPVETVKALQHWFQQRRKEL